MKCIFWVIVAIISLSISGVSQKGKPETRKGESAVAGRENQRCTKNPDPLYKRPTILAQFAEILNISVFGTRKDDYVFKVENERPLKFTIYDLTDTSNIGSSLDDCIKLINNHVYHFAPIQKRYSFSHIVILEDGAIKVFRSINCPGKGDNLEDVLSYLSQKLKDNKDKGKILSRVKNYRKYGIYTIVDTPDLQCKG